MDKRLYFVLGDLVSNVCTGIVVALLCWLIIDTHWNMWLAMFVAMAVGMLAGTLLWLLFGTLFGAMEVMVPLMLTGMVSGMVAGMWSAMHEMSLLAVSYLGGTLGLVVIVTVWVTNNCLQGHIASWEKPDD